MSEVVAAALLGAAVVVLLPASPAPPAVRRASGSSDARFPARSSRRRLAADRAAVLEVCDVLAAELSAGLPPASALVSAHARWEPLAAVVEASRLGADVPEALRMLAQLRPGAADLVRVAGAWQVAQESGHGLAAALERTAEGLRSRRRTRRLVDSELASARATARLVACLPVAVLVMGSGAGSDPWAFLLGEPVGWGCLGLGLALVGLGLWWIERLADRVVAP